LSKITPLVPPAEARDQAAIGPMFVHVKALSPVVPPTVVFQVGWFPPEFILPCAVVTISMLLLLSKIVLPTGYAVRRTHTAVVIWVVSPWLNHLTVPSFVMALAIVLHAGVELPDVPAVVTT